VPRHLHDIVGLGVDTVALPRFEEFLRRHEGSLGEVYTPAELAAAQGRSVLYLATRWALKEAALKALGTGWASGVQWTDVEAVGGLFAPRLTMRAEAARVAAEQGATALIGSAACAGMCVVGIAMLGRGPAAVGEA
jgi:holo-[acyl-carrier protein] synthase